MFGCRPEDYSYHFVIQVSDCLLSCGNCGCKENPKKFTAEKLVDMFMQFRNAALTLGVTVNVFCLGGASAFCCPFWKVLRQELDSRGMKGVMLLAGTFFVERETASILPWEQLDIHHFMLTGCLKGLDREDFLSQTGKDLFSVAASELKHYVQAPNFYLSLRYSDTFACAGLDSLIAKERVDFLITDRGTFCHAGRFF